MDARLPPSPPESAVSGLMQQLKSGEITKMQLFQQIAKLQAPSATPAAFSSAPPPPPPAPRQTAPALSSSQASFSESATSLLFGAKNSAAPPFPPAPPPSSVVFNYSPPHAFAAVASYSQVKAPPTGVNSTSLATTTVARFGAQPLPSDADIISSGVSHDKAPRLSVQEWIASKTRTPAPAPVVAPVRSGSLSSSIAPSLFNAPTSQVFNAPTSSNASASGPSLFSFLGRPQQDPSVLDHRIQDSPPPLTTREELQFNYPQQWGQQQQTPLNDHFQERYDDDPAHFNNGQQGDSDYHQFDPFQEDSHGRTDPNPSGGGKNNGGAGDEAKFHTRVTRWKSQKDAVREQMKQQLLQSELDECTFTPKVNPKSAKVVAKLRGRQRSVSGSESDGGGLGLGSGNSAFAVSERLYQEADNYKAREELAAKLKAEEEAELERECTFRPKINKSNPLTDKVKPKYMEIAKRDTPVIPPAAIEAAAKELEQCTFVPQVNAISEEMVSAQLYLQQNIYERLSRPCVASSEIASAGNRGGDDGASECTDDMDMLGSPRLRSQDDIYVRGNRRRRESMATGNPQHPNQRPRSAGGIVTDEEKAQRAKQFEEFLERQTFHEHARRKKIQVTQQQLVAPHKPSINKNSQMMMENGRKGDFLERISQYAIRKEQDTVKNKTVRVSDPQCTFKPTINPNSAKRTGRSVTELSRGDLLRRETTQRLMKLKMEQEEMASLTFRPELSRASQRVEGRLQILTSPDTYLQRIQQQSQAHMIKQRRAIQEKEMDEFSECTFKPRTIEAPAYVQRIARSVVLTKALKKQQEAVSKANQKPEWK